MVDPQEPQTGDEGPDVPTDAATLNSDAAIVDGSASGSGEQISPPAAVEAAAPPIMDLSGIAALTGASTHINAHARQRRYRKRALSTAGTSSGTIESAGGNPSDAPGASLLNRSIGSNIMTSGADQSIVSFGLNFNFDNTSSPSNSDSGEAKGGDDGSSGEDNNNAAGNGILKNGGAKDEKKKHRKKPSPENKSSSNKGSNEGKKSKSSSKSKKKKGGKKIKFGPGVAAGGPGGEEGESASSTSSGDDSGGDASGGSNSGNDGSSGGKSTVSSLTTSSNQEWMAANEAAANEAEAKKAGDGKAAGERGATDGKAAKKDKKGALSGKKGKKVSLPSKPEKTKDSEGDDDGYKTDEEQWGVNCTAKEGDAPNKPPAAKHKGSVLKSSLSKESGSNEAPPPLKQARFSMDPGHPANVQSADASAQPLSSLSGSDSAGVPAVTNSSGGRTPGVSGSSATAGNTASGGNPEQPTSSSNLGKRKAPETKVDPSKRKERNAREKERSCRIARQIDDLRALLSRGGVIVSKGTKSSVLAEAANYIAMLQQQQVQWEQDRQTLTAQVQQVAATPALQNNDMQTEVLQQQLQQAGLIPQQLPGNGIPMNALGQPQLPVAANPNSISPNDYKFIFDNSSVGMAIASLGGAFVDCNPIFSLLSEYTKEEITSMTIFNMTSRQDLQHAFDLISQMITPTLDANGAPVPMAKEGEDKSSIVLRGAMKKHSDLGLSISLIKGEQGVAKCFSVTLVRILSMETTRPDTVSIEMELPQVWSTKQQKNVGFGASPAYTAG